MVALVVGGASNGKSVFAETLAASCTPPLYYIAALEPYDDECLARIARHRAARAGRGFETVEQYTDIKSAEVPDNCCVLLECLATLTANEMFSENGAGAKAEEAVINGILSLASRCRDLIIVTNDVFSDGCSYDGGTLSYMRALASINRAAAARADDVIEVVCGIPTYIKRGGRICTPERRRDP